MWWRSLNRPIRLPDHAVKTSDLEWINLRDVITCVLKGIRVLNLDNTLPGNLRCLRLGILEAA